MGRAKGNIAATSGIATRGGRTAVSPAEAGVNTLRARYPEVTIYVGVSRSEYMNVALIEVPQDERGEGTGSAIMNTLCQIADENDKIITLSASPDFGSSKKFLTAYYKRFGFIENKGKDKDFGTREGMYRVPQKLK